MSILVSRRLALAGSLLVPALASLPAAAQSGGDAAARLAELERAHGGRLGVAALNLATGARIGYRADERFLLCSTFKALAAAFVLARVDRKQERLDRRIAFSRKDIVAGVSDVTKPRVGGAGMTVAELCDAAVTHSDNTAGNLLLASFGGPAGLTAFLRSLGDEASRLDRIEPELNAYAGPGDPRDTTTPAAVLETLRKLLFGDALSAASRHRLAAWLITNKTGDARLRAGFPAGWLVGDKTGTGGNPEGSTNDIAVAWPVDRGPVLVAAYCELPSLTFEQRNPVVAEIGGIVARL
ncbi:class A beta-lactamase [Inquilinus limosus]|uniref:Beta-lactamase n=1 Tax=Inquilinus limosus MP06 TaxID=1398085 RepID=A0A0A0DBY2_9PROT|nr:class A beta-lactamase [Inquilinus limosus]KGM35378.1 beta-lactamase [Inquilinus limosus MP06]